MSKCLDTNSLLEYPITLAPMVGLSHVAMRKALHQFFPSDVNIMWPTEMLNSRKLPSQEIGNTPETLKWENDSGLCPQILGNQQDYISESISLLKQWGAKAIDINMGCPVKKALKHNYGVSLMGDINYAKDIVRFAKESSDLPVSVKLRAGFQNDNDFLLKFTGALIDSGASWLCLHPRRADQGRKGNSDWSQIKLLKDHHNVPIIGNGDIQITDDIFRMLEQTNCNGVMIGRAFTAKPWLALEYAKREGYKLTDKQLELIPRDNHHAAIIYGLYLKDYINNCFDFFELKGALKRIRFFVRVSHVWLNFGHQLNKIVSKTDDQTEINKGLDKFFSNTSLRMSDRTSLRY